MLIALGCDHGGFPLKGTIIEYIEKSGHSVRDFGSYSPDPVDYPDIAAAVAEAVARGECESGILICGTGLGMSIAANKVRGIRAAAVADPYSAKMARQHNNAQILCFGARVVGAGLAEEIVTAFLSSEFLGGRHQTRVDKIMEIEIETQSVSATTANCNLKTVN